MTSAATYLGIVMEPYLEPLWNLSNYRTLGSIMEPLLNPFKLKEP